MSDFVLLVIFYFHVQITACKLVSDLGNHLKRIQGFLDQKVGCYDKNDGTG